MNADSHFDPEKPRQPPRGELPPVEPPTVGFILQLFVIPLVIVTIIVSVWLLFNWLAHMGNNPTELVRDLRKLNEASWQKALTLADLLRNPQNVHLKKDQALARELASVLADQMDTKRMEDNPLQLRVFLCRALGEFQVPDVLPVLLEAARTERAPAELQVRRSAVQALAIYISHNDAAKLRDHPELTQTLIDASRERTDADVENMRAELRSTAAFALGMLGGSDALDRLAIMLDDAYPNARYNAAVALSRHGDPRAIPVLLEMLDPESDESVRYEPREEGQAWKRLLVIQNGIRAVSELAEKNQSADLSPLATALARLEDSPLQKLDEGTHRGVRIEAEEALIGLEQRQKMAP